MSQRMPKQKIIRFNSPKYNNKDTDIWPWLLAQDGHLTKSLHLLINVAQAKFGNTDFLKAMLKSAIRGQDASAASTNSDTNKKGSTESSKSARSTSQASKASKSQKDTTRSGKSNNSDSSSSSSSSTTMMSHNQLKNAFLN